MAGTRRSTPARRSRRCGGPSSMCGPSPIAASERDSLTVTAKDVQPEASATRRASSASSGNRAATNRLSSRSPLERPSRTTRWRSRPPSPSREYGCSPRARQASATARRARFMRSDASRQSTTSTISFQDPRLCRPRTSRPPSSAPNENSILLRYRHGSSMPRMGSSSNSVEVRDALERVHHLLLLELQLRRVVQRLPLAAAALAGVAAARRDAARGGGRGSRASWPPRATGGASSRARVRGLPVRRRERTRRTRRRARRPARRRRAW